ncbi:tyrosine-type recombinase/integrase [Desulfopila sp. IMCC35008]|uniref:tyrosine-type recombinase/integrase n=1 Tax=Desulfopila sp. IMCC35008 TaxID=2653858 RepID=UPI003517770A
MSPHVLRHTSAVHLLQAGVDLSVIALWLGHESLESTQAYISSDLTQKIKILEKTLPINAKPTTFKPDDRLMEFLKAL